MGLNREYLGSLVAALLSGCLAAPPESRPASDGACGTLSSLSDDFDSGLSSWLWSPEGVWSADAAAIQLAPSPDTVSGIYSRQSWIVEGGQLTVGFDTSAMAPDSLLEIWLDGPEGEVSLSLEQGVLHANVYEEGFEGTRDSVAFDPGMRWWRIGRAGARLEWATSGDGVEWVDQGGFDANLAGLAELSIQHTARDNPSAVTVLAMNPGPESEPACRIDSFQDDFSAANPRWLILSEEVCEVQIAGRAEIGLSAPDACGLGTRERFSLTDSEVSVELAEASDCLLSPTLHVQGDGAAMEIGCRQGTPARLTAVVYGEEWADDLGLAEYDPSSHRFLRMRHAPEEGGLLFETSADRSRWDRLAVWDDVDRVDLTSVEVALIVYSDAPGDEVIAFDELNTPP